jgi:hypothetical protein
MPVLQMRCAFAANALLLRASNNLFAATAAAIAL